MRHKTARTCRRLLLAVLLANASYFLLKIHVSLAKNRTDNEEENHLIDLPFSLLVKTENAIHVGAIRTTKTHFTPHVDHLVNLTDLGSARKCELRFLLSVSSPNTIPEISVVGKNIVARSWLRVLGRVFAKDKGRVLPHNVTFGISFGDWMDPDVQGYGCFGSSGPREKAFTITNFEEVERMAKNKTYAILPWEDRIIVPIWRGSSWAVKRERWLDLSGNASLSILEQAIKQDTTWRVPTMRMSAVLFSKNHSDLLDAKFHSKRKGLDGVGLWENNATNGLYKLLPFDRVQKDVYYSNYQVALVLGGVGAAFRTGVHLSTGTAVLLADFVYEEWFTRFMEPNVHYIRVAKDLSNLREKLEWVRDNPEAVKEIGRNGKQFYDKYLSFEASEEFYYELFYKLALKEQAAAHV